MEPGALILCGAQLYVALGAPDARWYGYDTSGCDMAVQLDTRPCQATDGAVLGFWPTSFKLTAGGDLVLWWP